MQMMKEGFLFIFLFIRQHILPSMWTYTILHIIIIPSNIKISISYYMHFVFLVFFFEKKEIACKVWNLPLKERCNWLCMLYVCFDIMGGRKTNFCLQSFFLMNLLLFWCCCCQWFDGFSNIYAALLTFMYTLLYIHFLVLILNNLTVIYVFVVVVFDFIAKIISAKSLKGYIYYVKLRYGIRGFS